MIGLLFAQLRRNDFTVPEALLSAPCDLYHGDLIEGGRGEILLPAA